MKKFLLFSLAILILLIGVLPIPTFATDSELQSNIRGPVEPDPIVANGIYFIKNKQLQRYLQIDDDDSGNDYATNNAHLELWAKDGGAYQRWKITYVGNYCYRIISMQSGKAISVPSGSENSSANLVQQTYAGNDRQLWEIDTSSSGAYVFRPKSGANYSSDWCMAANYAPIWMTYNGRNAIQGTYVNNTSYLDEWELESTNSNIIYGVPTSLSSNSSHYCIPCAITNVAGYWTNHGYSQFGCGTSSEQETTAVLVQAAMGAAGSYTANAFIPDGYGIFSHTAGGYTYHLNSTNLWRKDDSLEFDWSTVVREIDAGRPLMMGFADQPGSPYASHMTTCVGYNVSGETKYVYLSDAHSHYYVTQVFNMFTYNNFVATVVPAIKEN